MGMIKTATHLSKTTCCVKINGGLHVGTIAEAVPSVMSSKITMLKEATLTTRVSQRRSLEGDGKNDPRPGPGCALNIAAPANGFQPPPHVLQSVAGSRTVRRDGRIFSLLTDDKTVSVVLQGQFK